MAYILGFFTADGYITVNKRGGQFWSIQIIDWELLKRIKQGIGSEHKVSSIKRKKDIGGKTSIYTIYRLQIGSIGMCDDLRRLGMRERKTKSLAIPNVPNKYFSDFTRGYFDGDGGVWVGYVHKKRITKLLALRSTFTSCSEKFLEVMRQKLEIFGIVGGCLRREKGNYHRLIFSIHGSLRLYEFMYNHRVQEIGMLHLERKKRIFERYMEMRL